MTNTVLFSHNLRHWAFAGKIKSTGPIAASPSKRGSMSNQRKRILIVDDDVSLGEVLQQALKSPSYPYEVRLARDADEALAHISRRRFDLIITDIKMGGLSGLQLLEALRHIAPEVTTVVMTAFDSSDIKDRARNLGVYAYLTKPFTIQEFRQCVQQALRTEMPSTPEKLPSSQYRSLNEALAELRANTGVRAAFFIEEQSTNILGVDSDDRTLDLSSLSRTLVDITQRMTGEISKAFGGSSNFQRIQYVGEVYNLSIYRLTGQGFLILVYDHQVKEGIISFYARQTSEQLVRILETISTASSTEGDGPAPAQQRPQAAVAGSTPADGEENHPEPIGLEAAKALGLLSEDFLDALENGE